MNLYPGTHVSFIILKLSNIYILLFRITDNNGTKSDWNLQGSTLSDVTAKKEYCLIHEFIIKRIRTGKLETEIV